MGPCARVVPRTVIEVYQALSYTVAHRITSTISTYDRSNSTVVESRKATDDVIAPTEIVLAVWAQAKWIRRCRYPVVDVRVCVRVLRITRDIFQWREKSCIAPEWILAEETLQSRVVVAGATIVETSSIVVSTGILDGVLPEEERQYRCKKRAC